MMSVREEVVTVCSMSPDTAVVEIHLLLPTHQFSALEAAASRSDRSVAALLRSTIGDFLQSQMVAQPNL